jgi:hypothetical protein
MNQISLPLHGKNYHSGKDSRALFQPFVPFAGDRYANGFARFPANFPLSPL